MADVRLPQGDISTWDEDNAGDEVPQRVGPMEELGVTGLKRMSGYVDEEFLPALRGRKAVRVYREMSSNDSMVGALLFSIDKLIREVEWKVLPPEGGKEGEQAQEFLEQCMEDMSHSWDDLIGEILSMIIYGWSWHEIVYKKRIGPWEKDPKKRSKYNDGKIGWRKMPIRAQETLLRWSFDETGGIRAMVQMAPPRYQTTVIPIEKSILFRTSIAKGNPEGLSLLRTSYRSWYFKKRLEEFEAIGVERDLAGMPVGRVPADYLTAAKGTPQAKTVDAFKKMVRGVRRDENEGLVLPTQYDPDTKQPLFDFELMSSGGTRQFDTNSIINRYEQRILMAVLADFILVGHEDTGSYSLHTDKTGIFRAALNAITKTIADTLNRYAVPRLFAVNGWKLDELPRFEPTNVDPPALDQLAAFISSHGWCRHAVVPGPGAGEVHPRDRPPAGDDRRGRRLQADHAGAAAGHGVRLGPDGAARAAAEGRDDGSGDDPGAGRDPLRDPAPGHRRRLRPSRPDAGPGHQPAAARGPERRTAASAREGEDAAGGQDRCRARTRARRRRCGWPDTMANRDHKRTKEQIRVKDSSAAKNAKLKIQQQKAAAKKPVKALAAKKTAKTAKKPPPKKKGR